MNLLLMPACSSKVNGAAGNYSGISAVNNAVHPTYQHVTFFLIRQML